MRALLADRAARPFLIAAGAVALATVVGLAVLWPSDVDPGVSQGLTTDTERAEVQSVLSERCPPPQPGICRSAEVELETGPDAGTKVTVQLGGEQVSPEVDVGDELRLAKQEAPAVPLEGGVAPAPEAAAYNFSDFERRAPMIWLAVAFAALVVLFGRLRGALSLFGLGLSLLLVLVFVVPAILDGKSPLAVAIFGSLAVMLVTITLAHGFNAKSLAAMLGTAASLALVALLAVAFTELAHLTGFASEEATLLAINQGEVSVEGLLLAGMVIGALGVLDDVTVSQASTVMALQAADPTQGFRRLYQRAQQVGRDHVSATVNTLVLAYVGAALPVLLLFSSSQLSFADAVNVELVATEIVAMLVGSIGIIAAVPLTTALAGTLATRLPESQLAEPEGHAH